MADAVRSALIIALGAFGLAGLASLWMARTLARPIDTLSRSLLGHDAVALVRRSRCR